MHNEAVNGHYHVADNGSVFYHVHPYQHHENNQSPIKDHNHSKIESVIYLSYTHPLFVLPVLIAFIIREVLRKIENIRFNIFTFSLQETIDSYELRGPPCISFK